MTDLNELGAKTAESVDAVAILAERELGSGHSPELDVGLQGAARTEGLLAPHAPVGHGECTLETSRAGDPLGVRCDRRRGELDARVLGCQGEALPSRVVDRSIQLAGGSEVIHETPLARFSTGVRAFRIYGPSEAPRWSIGRSAVRQRESERV